MAKALGENKILYIQDVASESDVLPLACLTSNVFNESAEFLRTTTRDNAGWNTSKPISQGYGVNFSAASEYSASGKFVINEIQDFKRAKTLIVWAIIDFEAQRIDYGRGYISNISETADVGGFVTFDGEIIGYGEPYNELPTPTITLIESTFIGAGNYTVVITFTSSDDPADIWARFYAALPITSGVNIYHDSVLQSSVSPVQADITDKEAIEGTSDAGTSDFTIAFQLGEGWEGPISNTVSHNVS